MRLTFYESGTYTGLVKGCDLDTSMMDKEEADRLQSLVDQSGVDIAKTLLAKYFFTLKSDKTNQFGKILSDFLQQF